MRNFLFKPVTLRWVSTALLASNPSCLGAGEAGKPTVAPAPPASNPLSVASGKLVFDVQDRLRLDARDNNFDFNAAKNAATLQTTFSF